MKNIELMCIILEYLPCKVKVRNKILDDESMAEKGEDVGVLQGVMIEDDKVKLISDNDLCFFDMEDYSLLLNEKIDLASIKKMCLEVFSVNLSKIKCKIENKLEKNKTITIIYNPFIDYEEYEFVEIEICLIEHPSFSYFSSLSGSEDKFASESIKSWFLSKHYDIYGLIKSGHAESI